MLRYGKVHFLSFQTELNGFRGSGIRIGEKVSERSVADNILIRGFKN